MGEKWPCLAKTPQKQDHWPRLDSVITILSGLVCANLCICVCICICMCELRVRAIGLVTITDRGSIPICVCEICVCSCNCNCICVCICDVERLGGESGWVGGLVAITDAGRPIKEAACSITSNQSAPPPPTMQASWSTSSCSSSSFSSASPPASFLLTYPIQDECIRNWTECFSFWFRYFTSVRESEKTRPSSQLRQEGDGNAIKIWPELCSYCLWWWRRWWCWG